MTHSPLTIGFASIIPGLGFWLLRQRQRSIFIGIIVFGLLFISLFFFGKPIGQFSAGFFLLAWLAQLVFAVQIARANQKQQNGEIQAPQPVSHSRISAAKLSRISASESFSREIANGQLQSGEHIIKSLIGKKHTSFGMTALAGLAVYFSASWYCVALTQSTLLLIELDFLLKPLGVKRIPLFDIIKATHKTGWLNGDRIRLGFKDGKYLDLEVVRSYRKQAQDIVSIFNKA